MNDYTDKAQENTKRSSADSLSTQQESNGFFLEDKRQKEVTQKMMDNRPQAKRLQAIHSMMDSAPVQKKLNSTGLPDNLKSGIENLSGHSMDDVKVHYNSDKPAQLNAYAQGTDIHIASNQEKHLPHEAWHVVQQKQGRVRPTTQMKGKVNVNDDTGLEKEADVMGSKALETNYEPVQKTQLTGGKTVQRIVSQLLPKFKEESDAIAYFEDEMSDNLEKHSEDVRLLREKAKSMEWEDLLERMDYYHDNYKPFVTAKIKGLDLIDQASLKTATKLLETVQRNKWDDLEEMLLPAIRKLEDDRPGELAVDKHNEFFTADDLPVLLTKMVAKPQKMITMALRGIIWGRYGGFTDKDLPVIAKQVTTACNLQDRIESVLLHGVLKPTDLEKSGIPHTPSSDTSAQDKISLFDVDMDRNKDGRHERFPLPGHQSIGPVLERRNDYETLIVPLYRAAKANKPLAITQFEDFRSDQDFAKFFPKIDQVSSANIDEVINILTNTSFRGRPLMTYFMAMLVGKPHLKSTFEGRAARSAMFISTGTKLETSSLAGDQFTSGANVQELRIGKSLQPTAISHVLVPEYMRGFLPLWKEGNPGIDFTTVENTEDTDVGYYNQTTGTSTKIQIKVPNYQAKIDSLIGKGNRKMLTHISNID